MKIGLRIIILAILSFIMAGCKHDITNGSKPQSIIPDVVETYPTAQTNKISESQVPETTAKEEDAMSNETIIPEYSLPIVYMTKDISPHGLQKVYDALNVNPTGKIAVKIASGEIGSNYLRPELIGSFIKNLGDASIVECNTIYGRDRTTTSKHKKTAKEHGFTDIAPFDVMDEDGSMEIPVVHGKYLKVNYVGKHFSNYNYFIILSHFKGHTMAGFGGAIKNVSIGIASTRGKGQIHGNHFIESMAEATKSVSDALHGNISYINVMNRLSLDCDCESDPRKPDMHDIGILSSLDPVALDQACVDLIYKAPDGAEMVKQIESMNGQKTLEHGEIIGLGKRQYRLISLD